MQREDTSTVLRGTRIRTRFRGEGRRTEVEGSHTDGGAGQQLGVWDAYVSVDWQHGMWCVCAAEYRCRHKILHDHIHNRHINIYRYRWVLDTCVWGCDPIYELKRFKRGLRGREGRGS